MQQTVDVLIIGAGAAGMMCAIEAARRGRKVLIVDHAAKLAEKIRISGGGRCNFTNINARPENYLSQNPHFCRSALARFTPQHIMDWLRGHGITFHEKKLGQLFLDEGSEVIIKLLKDECEAAGAHFLMKCDIGEIRKIDELGQPGFLVSTSRGEFQTASLVVASGGLSIPKIGATPLGYKIAEQFHIPVNKLRPCLVPLSFHPEEWQAYAGLSGISIDASVSFGKQLFRENLLVTHRGLSGPAILQISSYWEHGKPLHVDLLPDREIFNEKENIQSKQNVVNLLGQWLPKRFFEVWLQDQVSKNKLSPVFAENKPVNQYSSKDLQQLENLLHDWQITPTGTLGYAKAEVTCGGVDTRALSSKNMQANDVKGLYFIGEVVDVTGQLGGYNFQWAWASGYAAGQTC